MSDSYGNIPISPAREEEGFEPPSKKPAKKIAPLKKTRRDRSSLRRFILISLVCVFLIGACYGLSSFFVPIFIQQKFPSIFMEETGLNLSINSAHFNPLNCSVTIAGVKIDSINDDGSHNDLLSIDDLFIDFDFTSLLRNGLVSDKLEIKGAALTIRRHIDKTYNVSQLFSKYSDNPSDILEFAELPFLYSLNNISILDTTILFNDQISGKTHKIEDLRVSLPTLSNFSFDAGDYIQPRFSAVLNGSPIELVSETASTGQDDGSQTTLSCSLESIDIPLYAHYLPVPFPVDIRKGKADGELQISFLSQKNEGRHLTLNYQFKARDIQLVSHDEAITLSSPLIDIEGSLKPLTGDIELKSFILRDPELTIKKSFSATTVDSLFLRDFNTSETETVPLQLPSLNVALFIADNGKVIIEDDNKNRMFESVQLSIRNFSNTIAINKKIGLDKGTFKISAEAKDDFSTFSWQGIFNKSAPSGNLEINNLPLSDLLPFISSDTQNEHDLASGTVDIRGKFSASRSDNKSKAAAISFKQGTILASSISLSEGNVKWFNGPSVMLTPVSYTNGQFNFGNAILENTNLVITQTNLPTLLRSFSAKNGHIIDGIDLKGNISYRNSQKHKPLQLTKVHMQITNLSNKEITENNFTVSASSPGRGTVKADGNVSLSPLKGTMDLAFSNFPSKNLFPLFSASTYVLSATTTIDGNGTYQFPEKSFAGSLTLKNGTLQDTALKRKYRFSSADFGTIAFGPHFNNLDCTKIKLINVGIESDDFEMIAEQVTVSSLNRKKGLIAVGEVSFASSELSLKPMIPALLKSIIEEKKDQFSLKKLTISGNLSILSEDKVNKTPLFEEFECTIKGIGDSETKNNITLVAQIGENGTIHSEGDLQIQPVTVHQNLQLTNVDLDLLKPLHSSPGNYSLHGMLNGNIVHHYPAQTYTGRITLADGKLSLKDDPELISWKNATLHDFNYTKTPYHLGIAALDLDTPQLQFTPNETDLFERLNNRLNRLFEDNEKPTSSSSADIAKINIPQIKVTGGAIDYLDERLSPVWQTNLSEIEGQIVNLRVSDSPNTVTFNLRGDFGPSPFTIDGTVQLSPDSATADYSFNLTGFPLDTLDAQLQNLFEITTDNATFDLNYQRNDAQPQSSIAHFSFSSVLAQEEESETAQLLALLTGNNDRITQNVVFKKNTSLFSQTTSHFQKLFVKNSFSPFLLLQPPYDGLKNTTELYFKAGETRLSEDSREALAQYGRLLTSYPRLQLILKAVVDRSSDGQALKIRLEEEEKKRVKRVNEELLQKWQQQQIPDPKPTSPGDSLVVEDILATELEAFTPVSPKPIIVDDAILNQLGKNRLKQVSQYLLEEHGTPELNIMVKEDIILQQKNDIEQAGILFSLGHIRDNTSQSPAIQEQGLFQ